MAQEIPTSNDKYLRIATSPDGTQTKGYNKETKSWEDIPQEDWVDKLPVPSSVERGIRKATLIDDYAKLNAGLESPEDVSKEVARVSKKINEEPMTPKQLKGMNEINSSKSFTEFAENIVKNPSTVGAIFGESLGSMSGTGLAALGLAGVGKLTKASPWAARLLQAGAFGVGSGVTEATNTFFDGLSDFGVDTTDQDKVKEALTNPQIVERLNTKAVLRGVPVGAFDAITSGISGLPLEHALASGVTKRAALEGALTETAIQAAGGAAGEAGAQIASEGKITKPVDVGLEAIMEGITGVPEALYTSIATRPSSSLDLKMPGFTTETTDEATGQTSVKPSGYSPQEEVIGTVAEEKKATRKAKSPSVSPIIDSEAVGDLTAFKPIIDSVEPPVQKRVRKPKVAVAPPQEAQVETPQVNTPEVKPISFKLPEGLQKARVNFGTKAVNFESDVDRALFITSQDKKSKSDAKYRDWLKDHVGLTDEEITSKGKDLKASVKKAMAKVPEDTKSVKIKSSKHAPIQQSPREESASDLAGMGKGMANAISDNFYEGYFNSASKKKGSSSSFKNEPTWPSVKDKVEKGEIKSPSELKEYLNSPKVSFEKYPDTMRPNTRERVSFDAPKPSEGLADIPPTNNQLFDLSVENLRGIDLKDASPELTKTMRDVTNQIKKSFGEGPAVKFYKTLYEMKSGEIANPVRAAQWLNNIAIATELNGSPNLDPFDSGMHEGFHYAQDNLLTDMDKGILNNQKERIRKYVQRATGMNPDDILRMYRTDEGQREMEAAAFGLWASNKLKNPKYKPEFLTPALENVFNKVLRFLQLLAQAVRGKNFEDIFEDVFEGRKVRDVLADGLEANQTIRWQKIAQAEQKEHQNTRTEEAKLAVKELKKAVDSDAASLGPLGFYSRYLSSIPHLASKSKVFAFMYDTERRRQEMSAKFYTKHDMILREGGFHQLPREVKDSIHSVMDGMRSNQKRGKLDQEGNLILERDGKIIRISDKTFANGYMTLQKYYDVAKQDIINTLKGTIAKAFGFKDYSFTKNEVKAKLSAESNPVRKQLYQNILETLSSFEKVQASDYVPHQRFGNYGISVRDKKTGEVVYFTGIENGGPFDSVNKYFNKYQLKEVHDQLKAKYSDSSKYTIYGEGGKMGLPKSSEDLKPFVLTKDNVLKSIDSSAVSFDLLFSLMQSKGMDENTLSDLQNTLIEKLYTQGFAKHLMESKNIDGYSTDWTRVQHSYGTGISHYIGNLHVREKMQAIQSVIKEGAFKDPGMRDAAQSYANYIMSPAEDYMKMRMFNFMWTMGGNFSTAALQVFTLPTLTLANMVKFNPSMFGNLASLNKWMFIAGKFAKDSREQDGQFIVNFNNKDVIDALKASKVIDDKHAQLLEFAQQGGLTGAVAVEEYAGQRKYETRSTSGKIRDKLSVTANLLGAPISFMEQMTRFTSLSALYDQMRKVPNIEQKIMDVLGDDERFKQQVATRKELDLVQNAALYSMDEAHAVFGKVGRSRFQRGLGGALFFPFMTYPQNAIESMVRMFGQGKAGKSALLTSIGTLMLFSGVLGLPGAELLKELYEGLYKKFAGEDIDIDYLIREKIYDLTGSSDLAVGVTKGALRPLAGVDIGSRIGLQVPGQDVLLTLLGMRGDASDVLGVQGSLMSQIADFWNKYSTDASLASSVSSLTPMAISNMFKAAEYVNEGVYTNKNKQLIAPDDVSAATVGLRAMGVNSNQVATVREQNFYSKLLESRYNPFIEESREKAKKHLVRYYRYLDKNETGKASEEYSRYQDVLQETIDTAKKKNFPFDAASFNRSVQKGVAQRLNPDVQFKKNLNKQGKMGADKLNEVLGLVD